MIYSLFDKVFDRRPEWGKVIFCVLAIIVGAYASVCVIAEHGIGYFLLRLIFSP